MPSFMEMLRLRNIFGQPQIGNVPIMDESGAIGAPSPFPDLFKSKQDPYGNISFGSQEVSPPTTPSPQPGGFNVEQRMRELYQPQTEAGERFGSMIGEYPKAEDYKPSMLRRIGAAVSAIGSNDPRVGMEVLNRPYNKQLQDWKAQIEPAQRAAEIERQGNVTERSLAGQVVTQERLREADVQRARTQEEANKIRQQRADVYEWKTRNPQGKIIMPKGGFVQVVDPVSKEVITLKGSDGQPIETGSLSDTDRMALQQAQSMERIGATGEEQRRTEELRQTGREGLAETRGWTPFNTADGKTILVNQITGETKPITGVEGQLERPGTRRPGVGGESPAQLKVRQFNTARELKDRNPELGKWISLQSGNQFTIQQPGRWSGPTQEQYNQIVSQVYGEEPAIQQPSRTGAPTTVPNVPPGRVAVKDESGKIVGTVPESQIQLAESQGYTVVR